MLVENQLIVSKPKPNCWNDAHDNVFSVSICVISDDSIVSKNGTQPVAQKAGECELKDKLSSSKRIDKEWVEIQVKNIAMPRVCMWSTTAERLFWLTPFRGKRIQFQTENPLGP